MNEQKSFSFKIYVRTCLLAEKVKGLVRNITTCIHKGEAVDDLNALVPFHEYIYRKLFNAIEHLPPINQIALTDYLRQHGWQINEDVRCPTICAMM